MAKPTPVGLTSRTACSYWAFAFMPSSTFWDKPTLPAPNICTIFKYRVHNMPQGLPRAPWTILATCVLSLLTPRAAESDTIPAKSPTSSTSSSSVGCAASGCLSTSSRNCTETALTTPSCLAAFARSSSASFSALTLSASASLAALSARACSARARSCAAFFSSALTGCAFATFLFFFCCGNLSASFTKIRLPFLHFCKMSPNVFLSHFRKAIFSVCSSYAPLVVFTIQVVILCHASFTKLISQPSTSLRSCKRSTSNFMARRKASDSLWYLMLFDCFNSSTSSFLSQPLSGAAIWTNPSTFTSPSAHISVTFDFSANASPRLSAFMFGSESNFALITIWCVAGST
mmetsp:Transcript_23423/g.54177  ORF Transcript_23423/g.54177 Transcript_23423/m.54177 type:complete len:346 (+) Transcript_23423:740-1777(+)